MKHSSPCLYLNVSELQACNVDISKDEDKMAKSIIQDE